jgi:hypothetical protein
MNPAILHKKIRNLSPIRRSEEVTLSLKGKKDFKAGELSERDKHSKNEKKSKLKNDTIVKKKKNIQEGNTKSDSNSKEKNENKKDDLNLTDDPRIRYPKNINEYRHIMSNFQLDSAGLSWILDLRTNKEKIKYDRSGIFNSQGPTFYNDDLDIYRQKVDEEKRQKLTTAGGSNSFNSNDIKHLAKDRLGATANSSQFSFETTLRNFRQRPGNKTMMNETWKSVGYSPKRLNSSIPFLPPTSKLNQNTLAQVENYTVRPYTPVYDVCNTYNYI